MRGVRGVAVIREEGNDIKRRHKGCRSIVVSERRVG